MAPLGAVSHGFIHLYYFYYYCKNRHCQFSTPPVIRQHSLRELKKVASTKNRHQGRTQLEFGLKPAVLGKQVIAINFENMLCISEQEGKMKLWISMLLELNMWPTASKTRPFNYVKIFIH